MGDTLAENTSNDRDGGSSSEPSAISQYRQYQPPAIGHYGQHQHPHPPLLRPGPQAYSSSAPPYPYPYNGISTPSTDSSAVTAIQAIIPQSLPLPGE